MDQPVLSPDAPEDADILSDRRDTTRDESRVEPGTPRLDGPTGQHLDGITMPRPPESTARLFQSGVVILEPTLPEESVSAPARAPMAPLPRSSSAAREAAPFPEVAPLRVPAAAWIVGRAMIGLAVVGAGDLMRTTADRGVSLTSKLPELAIVAATLVAGFAATAGYTAAVAGGARRLQLSTPRARTAAMSWLLPLAWVVCGTGLMGIDVTAEVDPMPGIAVVGLALALGVPYLVAGDTTRPLARGRNVGPWWLAMYVADVVAIGIAWCAVVAVAHEGASASWARPAVRVAALVSVVSLLIAVAVAARIPRLFRCRLDDLEQRWTAATDPAWFRSGFGGRSTGRPTVALVGSTWSRHIATAAAAAWAASVAITAVVAGSPVWFGASAPASSLRVPAVGSMVAGGAFTLAFGVWSTIAAVNARRVRPVGAVTPSLPAVLALPVPIALVVAAGLGGDLGWQVAAGAIAGGCSLGMVGLRALGGIATSLRASAPLFSAWVLVMALAAIAFGGGYAALGSHPEPWTELGIRHLFVAAQFVILAVAAVLGRRAMASFDEHVAAAA